MGFLIAFSGWINWQWSHAPLNQWCQCGKPVFMNRRRTNNNFFFHSTYKSLLTKPNNFLLGLCHLFFPTWWELFLSVISPSAVPFPQCPGWWLESRQCSKGHPQQGPKSMRSLLPMGCAAPGLSCCTCPPGYEPSAENWGQHLRL